MREYDDTQRRRAPVPDRETVDDGVPGRAMARAAAATGRTVRHEKKQTGSGNEQTLFRHGRHSRHGQPAPDDRRGRDAGRHGGGTGLPARLLPAPGGDRQGYAAVELHDRERHGGRLHGRRRRRVPARAHADPGRGHADPVAARRYRRDDLGLAQSVRGQWHQAVRAGRLQALRRAGAAHRGAAGRGSDAAAGDGGRPRPGKTHRRRPRPLHRGGQADVAARAVAGRRARRHRLRQRRGLPGGAGRSVGARRGDRQAGRRSGRHQHQSQLRLDGAGGADREGQGSAGRHRHRARRRCRPGADRRRARRGGRR